MKSINIDQPNPIYVFKIALLVLLSQICSQASAQVTTGNVLVANGGFVYEYQTDGTYVGQVTSDLRNGVDAESRGIAYDHLGRIHVLIRPHDGADDMFLATYDPSNSQVTNNEITFHNHNGNTTYGDIAVDNNYVYAPDQIFGRQEQGVVRYSLNNLSSIDRVLNQYAPSDVSIGLDGLLYVQTANLREIEIVNPNSLTRLGGFSTPSSLRDVVATSDGTIFSLHNDNMIRRYDSTGTLLGSLQLASGANHSMDLARDGTIVVGSAGDSLYFTDTSLSGFTEVLTPNSNEANWGNFVTFVEAVPEPGSLPLLILCGLSIRLRRTRRS